MAISAEEKPVTAPTGTAASALPIDLKQASPEMQAILVSPEGKSVISEGPLAAGERPEKKIYAAIQIEKKLARCLRENLCGETPHPGMAYFDPIHTPAHWLLNKSLRYLLAVSEKGDSLTPEFPPDEELLKNLGIPNAETQILSTKLLARADLSGEQLGDLLTRADLIAEDGAASFFATLLEKSTRQPGAREKVLERLKQTFPQRDINWTFDVIQNVEKLKLTPTEALQVFSATCFVKSDPKISHNWKMLSQYMGDYLRVASLSLELCTQP